MDTQKRPRGRPTQHGLTQLRRSVTQLGTHRLDGRRAVAVAARRFKADVTRDLGGNLTRSQEAAVELAAQTWLVVGALDDWLSRQPSLVTRRRQLLPVVMQRQALADSLVR